jgi:quinol-cytochrome oxidoreductase complex cytochrome b subunit
LLPLLAILLVYLHYSGVRRVGLGEKSSQEAVQASVSIRAHLANQAILLTVLFGVLVTLAVLAPVPFMEQVDAYSTLPDARPPWYLLAPFGFLEWSSSFLPQWFAGLLLFAGFTAFLFLPFIDRGRAEARRRPLTLLVGLLVVAVWLVFTIYGARVA